MKRKSIYNKILMVALFVATTTTLFSQDYSNDNPAYVIYDKEGNKVSYSHMLEKIAQSDVCLFGELHDDPISHWLELRLVKSLYHLKGENLVVGAEMWERDNQLLLDEMQRDGYIDGPTYMESSKLWPNTQTDYLPILQYSKSNGIPFIATNIPRRYARIIYKKGVEYLDSLSPLAKSYLPPLPVHFNLDESIYQIMAAPFPTDQEFEKMKEEGKTGNNPMTSGKPSNLVKAQAIKDATMAWFIKENMDKGDYFFHFNGELHSANYTAIYYYLGYYAPELKTATISIVKTQNVMEIDREKVGRADFVIQVPDDMIVTY